MNMVPVSVKIYRKLLNIRAKQLLNTSPLDQTLGTTWTQNRLGLLRRHEAENPKPKKLHRLPRIARKPLYLCSEPGLLAEVLGLRRGIIFDARVPYTDFAQHIQNIQREGL